MSEQKHTPGPWTISFNESAHRKGAYGDGPGSECGPRCKPIRVDHSPDGEGRWAGVDEIHVEHSGVADILAPNGEHVVCLGAHDYYDYGVIANDADAHLIAAAPDLLEALKELAFWCRGPEDADDKESYYEAQRLTDAAIAKAEGR